MEYIIFSLSLPLSHTPFPTQHTHPSPHTTHTLPTMYPHNSQYLVSGIHFFLQYSCGYVRLGHTYLQEVGGAWGGVESIGKQEQQQCQFMYFLSFHSPFSGSNLLQLQSEISQLKNPMSPDEVGVANSIPYN